ncbi:MAG: hypothetical protein ACI9B9_001730 [Halioglobus sp.]|jgi:hypothetical protein
MMPMIRALNRHDLGSERVAKANGFSLHAGVSCEGHQKDKRERLCRYIARPAVAVSRPLCATNLYAATMTHLGDKHIHASMVILKPAAMARGANTIAAHSIAPRIAK